MQSTIRHRLKSLVLLLLLGLTLPLLIGAGPGDPRSGPPGGSQPANDPGKMVWVCKYVAIPGTDHLRVKPGQNPIHVNAASITMDEDGNPAFADAHTSLLFDQGTGPDCEAENPARPPDPVVCLGTVSAAMVDADQAAVAGGNLSSSDDAPVVVLNGALTDVACDPDLTDPEHTYSATPPEGWRFVRGTDNPQRARIDAHGDTVALRWVVETIPDAVCTGTITARMIDGEGNGVAGSVDGEPTVALNGAPTSSVDCGAYRYTATAPIGWQFVSGTTNPQTAQIDTDGQTVTLTWTVEKQPLTCPSGTVPSEDGRTCVEPEGPVEGGDPTVEEEVIEEEKDPVVVEDPVVDDSETVCEGALGLRVTDLLGEPVPGASVALGDETHSLTSGQHDETLPCGSVEVELTSVPGGYVFVRTEVHGTSTLSAQSTHTKSQKVSAVVSDDAPSTVVFVVDPLEVMPEEITGPAPEREPLGAPSPATAQDEPQPAPQPAPVEPVAAPTLPRTGIPAGRLLTLAILMLTAGGAMLGSRRSIDR